MEKTITITEKEFVHALIEAARELAEETDTEPMQTMITIAVVLGATSTAKKKLFGEGNGDEAE